jgi:hypothetical protein
LTRAKTGVKYSQNQWRAVQHVRKHLRRPESTSSDSTDLKDQDPELTNALMRLCKPHLTV